MYIIVYLSSGGWVKIKSLSSHTSTYQIHVVFRYRTHAPVATTARAAATGPVSMSTREAYITITVKPSNSATQGQPIPRKITSKKRQLGHFSPRQLGLVLYRKQTTRNLTQPHYPQTPYLRGTIIIRTCDQHKYL